MSSCLQVATLALGKLGIAGGTKSPRSVDLELALKTLQSLYRELIDSGALGRPNRVIVTGDYIAGENDHIQRKAGNITLPSNVNGETYYTGASFDCDLDYGGGDTYSKPNRPPRNGAFVVINDSQSGRTSEYIWDGYTSRWMTIGDLSLDDNTEVKDAQGVLLEVRTSDAPLSANTNGLAALLAVNLADHYGSETLTALTVKQAQSFKAALITHYGDGDETTPICPY